MQDKNPYAASKVATTRDNLPGGSAQPREFGMGEVIRMGLSAVMKQPLPLIGGFALTFTLIWAVQQVPQLVVLLGILPADPIIALAIVTLASVLLGTFVSSFLSIGQIRVALSAARGETVEFAQFFSGADRFGTLFLMNLLMGAAIFLGSLLFVVPGIIAVIGFSLGAFFVADTDCSAWEALSESWAMTKGFKWKLFGLVFVAAGVALLGVLCLLVGIFVVLPALFVAYAIVYMRLTGNVESAERL